MKIRTNIRAGASSRCGGTTVTPPPPSDYDPCTGTARECQPR